MVPSTSTPRRLIGVILSFSLILTSLPASAIRFSGLRPGGARTGIKAPAPAEGVRVNAFQFLEMVSSLPEFEGAQGLHPGAAQILLQVEPLLRQGEVTVTERDGGLNIVPAGATGIEGVWIPRSFDAAEIPGDLKVLLDGVAESVQHLDSPEGVLNALETTANLYREGFGQGPLVYGAPAGPILMAPRLGEKADGIQISKPAQVVSEDNAEVETAQAWNRRAGWALHGLSLGASVLAGGLLQLAGGIDGAVIGVPVLSGLLYGFYRAKPVDAWLTNGRRRQAEKAGGRLLSQEKDSELIAEIAAAAEAEGIDPPEVYEMPESWDAMAFASIAFGTRTGILLLSPRAIRSEQRASLIAHELRHISDARTQGLPLAVGLATNAAFVFIAVNALFGPLGFPSLMPDIGMGFAGGLMLLSAGVWKFLKPALTALIEWRANLAAVEKTGSSDDILKLLEVGRGEALQFALMSKLYGRDVSVSWREIWNSFLGKIRNQLPSDEDANASSEASSVPAAEDPTKAAYYTRATPDWAARLDADKGEMFASDADYQAYRQTLDQLRPLARWMAHFYSRMRDEGVENERNILTLQDVLNWVIWMKKADTLDWKLMDSAEEGAAKFFKLPLPSELVDDRNLRAEYQKAMDELKPILEKIDVPESIPTFETNQLDIDRADTASGNEEPATADASQIEAMPSKSFIRVPAVNERLEDLMMLYSAEHQYKFFPLLVGPTAEGKSSVVKAMFSDPRMIKALGREVPVVSQPVKEQMTKRELFGAPSSRGGIELGFLAQAAEHGWVLVLEELNEASGEFLKSLNGALHQIRKYGWFEFEVGGKTQRIKVHPHFWVVGTENPAEGNYAYTREQHSPDFVKRWVYREYDPIPPAQQAEIMYGLAVDWHGKDFVKKHGVDLALLETIMTQIHEPIRRSAKAGKLGGDNLEEYEFNRRTLHRFLKRYLADIQQFEAGGRKVDEKTRRMLMARELMETYATELREESEADAVWDTINIALDLQSRHGIQRTDIELDIQGFYIKDGHLVVEENLVPVRLRQKTHGGDRIPGPENRLTLVPSLMRALYRAVRNRQFGEHQFSSGPTGAAKTSGQFFLAHLLQENLFTISIDEQTANREFHGGFVRDPKSGEFVFNAGILARAMMYDPSGKLKAKLTPSEIRELEEVGATLLIDEANASTIAESANPALDDGVLHLSDGQSTAIAGKGFHVIMAMNPVGEGYVGFPLSDALRSRGQTVYHGDIPTEDELTEIILDELTGVRRHLFRANP